ncbi:MULTISPECIES: hypothetical protein [unclassified Roseovarius]|uniref:hypothetical protein n=1 Tax=unclassified Roseovarius TaxID=2614913 RepID=UPI00273F33AD|nr:MULTISPECIES: hypothetical protein [unclassified Roseovarius]
MPSKAHGTIAALMLWPVLAACSVNDFGVVEARAFAAGDAKVRTTSAVGLHTDARNDRSSLTLGVFDAAWIVPPACQDTGPRRPPLLYSRMIGLQIAIGRDELRFSLGLHERLLVQMTGEGAGAHRSLSFRPSHPDQTVFTGPDPKICNEKENKK